MTTNIRGVIKIRYALIRDLDLSNGEGIGVALFVQGCHFHCKNCFNHETWDFDGGKEWSKDIEDKFLELAARPYIKRISILGGEPLVNENLEDVLNLVNKIHLSLPKKAIWLYSGYKVEKIYNNKFILSPSAHDITDIELDYIVVEESNKDRLRSEIISKCTVMVDGRYIDSKRDIKLQWCGSINQSVIDIQQSLQKGEVVLWKS